MSHTKIYQTFKKSSKKKCSTKNYYGLNLDFDFSSNLKLWHTHNYFFDISLTFRRNATRSFGFIVVCGTQDHERTEDDIWRNCTRHTSKINVFFLQKMPFFLFFKQIRGIYTGNQKKPHLSPFLRKKQEKKFQTS